MAAISGEDDDLVAKQIAQEISMIKGSALHEKTAATSIFTTSAQQSYDQARGAQLHAYRLAQAARTKLNPFVSAEYKPYTDKVVEDIRGYFNEILQAEAAGEGLGEKTDEIKYFVSSRRQAIATHLDQVMRELVTNKGVGNLLDVYDTMEASIVESFGPGSEKVLNELVSTVGSPDMSERLMELRDDSMRRRVAKVNQSRVSQDLIESLDSIDIDFSYLDQVNDDRLAAIAATTGSPVPPSSYLSFENIDQTTAKGLLNEMHKQLSEQITSGTVSSTTTVPDFFGISEETYNYLSGTAGRTRTMTEEELNIFEQQRRYLTALADEQDILSRYGTGIAPTPPPGSAAAGASAASAPPPTPTASYIDDLITSVDDLSAAASTPAKDKIYTRFGRMLKSGGMKELFDDSIIRNSAYAMVGLAAFGFIYSARKERTQEEIQGPPLLPGGSAYESDFPRALPSISDLKYLNPTTAAMSYKINLSGSQKDLEKLQELAGGVAQGPINTTMYNGLPRLGRDPYSNVASSF